MADPLLAPHGSNTPAAVHPLSQNTGTAAPSSSSSGAAEVGDRPKAAALFQCGMARLKLEDKRGAYEDFREASRIDPQNVEIWQKYEETYREVEDEINADHAANPQVQQSRHSVSREEGAPRHFTLKKAITNPSRMAATSSAGRGEEQESEHAAPLKATHLRGLHSVANDASQSGDKTEAGRGGQRLVELPVVDEKVWIVANLSWFITWTCVLYHYRFETEKYKNIGWGTTDYLLSICWLAAWLWVFSKRKTPISLSLSDATKLLCVLIIGLCTTYHYYHAP